MVKHWLLAVVTLVTAQMGIAQDLQADNMLVFQRAIGGWPKHLNEVKIDYTTPLSAADKAKIKGDSLRKDATIDNNATTKEIRYLANAFKTTGNQAYKQAAEKGIYFLLRSQNNQGGWPQYYQDSSLYRAQITYNDNAMVNVLNLLMDVKMGIKDMDIFDPSLKPKAAIAINNGVQCILNTQIKVNDNLTAWCAQHDRKTLLPVAARKFELASISGSESVGIVQFLMRLEQPSPEIKKAVTSAVQWFQSVKVDGFKYEDVKDPTQPKGIDRVLVADKAATVWARFYDLQTQQPIFCGRDGIKKTDVKDIEYERRTGYAWYGVWPQKLIDKDYPKWVKLNS